MTYQLNFNNHHHSFNKSLTSNPWARHWLGLGHTKLHKTQPLPWGIYTLCWGWKYVPSTKDMWKFWLWHCLEIGSLQRYKMKWYWSRVDHFSRLISLLINSHVKTQRCTERLPCKDEGRRGVGCTRQSKEHPGLLANHQERGRGEEELPCGFQRERGSAHTLVSDS